MKLKTYNILEDSDSAVEQPSGFVVVAGEGREEIKISIDNYGRLQVSSSHRALIVRPQAANSIHLTTEDF